MNVGSVRLQADRYGPAKAGHYVRAAYTLGGDEGSRAVSIAYLTSAAAR